MAGNRMVGMTGFEPATSCSQSRRATKLRHIPTLHSGIDYSRRFEIRRKDFTREQLLSYPDSTYPSTFDSRRSAPKKRGCSFIDDYRFVPALSWAQPSSYTFRFKGIPKHSTVATSAVGATRNRDAQEIWHDGMREAMRRLEPSRVLLYGKNIGFDFGTSEVVEYKAGGFHGR